jgi:hypothetical protein
VICLAAVAAEAFLAAEATTRVAIEVVAMVQAVVQAAAVVILFNQSTYLITKAAARVLHRLLSSQLRSLR